MSTGENDRQSEKRGATDTQRINRWMSAMVKMAWRFGTLNRATTVQIDDWKEGEEPLYLTYDMLKKVFLKKLKEEVKSVRSKSKSKSEPRASLFKAKDNLIAFIKDALKANAFYVQTDADTKEAMVKSLSLPVKVGGVGINKDDIAKSNFKTVVDYINAKDAKTSSNILSNILEGVVKTGYCSQNIFIVLITMYIRAQHLQSPLYAQRIRHDERLMTHFSKEFKELDSHPANLKMTNNEEKIQLFVMKDGKDDSVYKFSKPVTTKKTEEKTEKPQKVSFVQSKDNETNKGFNTHLNYGFHQEANMILWKSLHETGSEMKPEEFDKVSWKCFHRAAGSIAEDKAKNEKSGDEEKLDGLYHAFLATGKMVYIPSKLWDEEDDDDRKDGATVLTVANALAGREGLDLVIDAKDESYVSQKMAKITLGVLSAINNVYRANSKGANKLESKNRADKRTEAFFQ